MILMIMAVPLVYSHIQLYPFHHVTVEAVCSLNIGSRSHISVKYNFRRSNSILDAEECYVLRCDAVTVLLDIYSRFRATYCLNLTLLPVVCLLGIPLLRRNVDELPLGFTPSRVRKMIVFIVTSVRNLVRTSQKTQAQLQRTVLILGWCILLRLIIKKNDSTTLVRNLSCLYCKQTTLHVSAKFRCVVYIKMLQLVIIT
jgi:hypothetical protein